jgi:hypothetical protein
MRYSIQPATSSDVAFLALAIDPDATEWGQGDEADQTSRLLHTCAASTQVWAIHDKKGVPQALWGVSPNADDDDVGCMWLLACEQLEDSPSDLRALSTMVLDEMFMQYSRLENYVDADKTRAIDLLRCVGFTVEPAVVHIGVDMAFHRVWMESEGRQSSIAVGSQLVN